MAMSLTAAALCCSEPASAQDRSSSNFTAGITAPGLTLSSSGAGELTAPGASESPHVTFGRDQDIVGLPVSVVRPGKAGTVLGGRRAMRMPGIAVMPSRLPLAGATLTSRFGLRRHPLYGDLRSHAGVDLAAPSGTPVYAPTAGYVGSAGWSGGYGLMIAIDHPGGMETRYGHLSRVAVTNGQYVPAGTLIGYVGSTGDSTGPHLHYEIRIDGQPINPLGR
jgi:murein DD-endopeptidase MepM/ murein hydrolase activator NlpD